MDNFEYLISLVSVIAGLGVARALSGLARVLNARREISFSAVPVIWTVSVLLWLVAFWWFTFLLSQMDDWSPWLHIFVLVYAAGIYFLVALLHPESIESGHDMLAHFLDNRKVFFGTLLVVALTDIGDTLIKASFGLLVPSPFRYTALMVSWIGLSLAGMFVAKRTAHLAFAALFLVVVLIWLTFSITAEFLVS